jgi:hypothetical protein
MKIHFISSLTVDDEGRVAAVMLDLSACLLEHFALAYSVRIETSDGQVFERKHPAPHLATGLNAAEPAAKVRSPR